MFALTTILFTNIPIILLVSFISLFANGLPNIISSCPVYLYSNIKNAEINNIADKCEFIVGDLADKISGKYKVICANIVADVIIRLFENVEEFMTEDGVFIISGIIDIRKDDVLASVAENGFTIEKEAYKDNWCAFVLKKN